MLQQIQSQLNLLNLKEDNNNPLLACRLADVCKFAELYHKDAVICETRLLPADASDEEQTAFMKLSSTASEFEMFLMLATMLVNDSKQADDLLKIGTTEYDGRYNPRDCGWFKESSDYDSKSMLRYIQEWYDEAEENRRHFSEYYDLAKRLGIDYPWYVTNIRVML